MEFDEKAATCPHGHNVEGATEVLDCDHEENKERIIFLGNEITLCNPHTCPR